MQDLNSPAVEPTRPQLKGEILSPEPPGKSECFPVLFRFSAHNRAADGGQSSARWLVAARPFCAASSLPGGRVVCGSTPIPFGGTCRDDCTQLAISPQLLTYELLSVASSSPEPAQLCLWPAESELHHVGPRLSHHSGQSLTLLGCDESLQVNYPLTAPKGPWSRSSACATGEGEKTKA